MPKIGARHRVSHQDGGNDEIDATELTGRCDFVDRGDPPAWDYTITNFPISDVWTELDLSSIIPSGAKAALFRFVGVSNNANEPFDLRKKGNSNIINVSYNYTQAAGIVICKDCIVHLSTDRKIDYYRSGTGWTGLYLLVAGWWI